MRLNESAKIDNISNIKGKKVFIFFGEQDKVLAEGVTQKANDYYRHFGADVFYEVNPETTHPFPTDLPEIEGVQAR